MTSSLPNFLSETPAGAAAPSADPAIQSLLDALPGPLAGNETSAGGPLAFATFLAPPAPGTAAVPLPVTGAPRPFLVRFTANAAPVAAMVAAPAEAWMATDAVNGPVTAEAPVAIAAAAPELEAVPGTARLDEDAVEQIAAVVVALLQTLPPVAPPALPGAGDTVAAESAPEAETASLSSVSLAPGGARSLASARVSVRVAGQPAFEIPVPVATAVAQPVRTGAASSPETPAMSTGAGAMASPDLPDPLAAVRQALTVAVSAPNSPALPAVGNPEASPVWVATPAPTVANRPVAPGFAGNPGGASSMPRPQIVEPILTFATDALAAPAGETAAEVEVCRAEFVLADGTAVEVAVVPGRPATEAARPLPADSRAVNIAASARPDSDRQGTGNESGEKTFLTAGNKSVRASARHAGIAVAQTPGTMAAAAFAQHRALEKPELPVVASPRLDLLPVQPRSPEAEYVASAELPPASEAFAHRAVQTVVHLADAQFSASLNRTHSVNLRLKFAGEDLTVRVELRDGAVHADFRTDSPELRTLLQNEWQAVVAAPAEQRVRFSDPVFGPAGHPGGAPASQDQSGRQQSPGRPAEEFAGQSPFAVRPVRQAPGGPVDSVDAAARVPLMPPTALRLSVLA